MYKFRFFFVKNVMKALTAGVISLEPPRNVEILHSDQRIPKRFNARKHLHRVQQRQLVFV